MAITEKCYSHLTAVADDWENYATLISTAMDKLDKFAKVYEYALSTSIKNIVDKLRDHETADMVRSITVLVMQCFVRFVLVYGSERIENLSN